MESKLVLEPNNGYTLLYPPKAKSNPKANVIKVAT